MSYAEALSALADPTRRKIFEQLRRGGASVGALAGCVPVSRPAVSQHLKVLKQAGLVREQRAGAMRIYRVDVRGLAELRRYLDGLWGDVLSAFEDAAIAEAEGRRHER